MKFFCHVHFCYFFHKNSVIFGIFTWFYLIFGQSDFFERQLYSLFKIIPKKKEKKRSVSNKSSKWSEANSSLKKNWNFTSKVSRSNSSNYSQFLFDFSRLETTEIKWRFSVCSCWACCWWALQWLVPSPPAFVTLVALVLQWPVSRRPALPSGQFLGQLLQPRRPWPLVTRRLRLVRPLVWSPW